MESQIILVPLTKKEFKLAKIGKVIEKRCEINDSKCCILISDRFINSDEVDILLDLGLDVMSIDISDIIWWDLDRTTKYNIVAEYENGISLCLISQNMYNQLQKEKNLLNEK